MDIQINTANTLDGREAMIARLEGLVRERLARFDGRLTRIELHLSDINGPRTEGDDIRCQLEARLAGAEPLSVTDQAATADQAAAGALTKAATALDRAIGRTTSRKGH
ncbi:MAG TPA: hypothetical protein VGN74_07735 [Brevundimonas sp.]|jgi:hypothetical protein|uniref:hypothetical protein n=1 Tax=Brevundimonas sp. TaxID=1871086 RepID=UPI002E0D4372|nr:hypothetical protein [Brevundimonas sp.]